MTTQAYRGFVAEHGLQDTILELARPAVVAGRASFEASSQDIFREFRARELSAAAAREVRAAYAALPGEPAVAVRSSGTAEDLPGFSFAGQHETFLNVTGADAVVAAVRNCWASLWSPQAISYRHQNGIAHSAVAMGVVVQVMVPSEVAGIIFTANPATGDRNEMVINASFGLGEAVVSGQVTPDTYMVDKAERAVSEAIIGPKEQQIVSDGDQGVRMEDVGEGERGASSLSDGQLSELIGNAVRLEELYDGVPQDIEWAFVGGVLHLLQSRPITLLPPSLSEHGLELDWTPDPPARCKHSKALPPRCRLTPAVAANRPHAAPDRGEHAGPALPAVRGTLSDGRPGVHALKRLGGDHQFRQPDGWRRGHVRHKERLRVSTVRLPAHDRGPGRGYGQGRRHYRSRHGRRRAPGGAATRRRAGAHGGRDRRPGP